MVSVFTGLSGRDHISSFFLSLQGMSLSLCLFGLCNGYGVWRSDYVFYVHSLVPVK